MRTILLTALALTACSDSKPAKKGPDSDTLLDRVRNEKPIVVTYYDLIRAYESNEVAADAKFKGVVLSVPGVIQSVTKEGEQTIVGISGPEVSSVVRCVYGGSARVKEIDVLALARGLGVEVHGIGDGLHSGQPTLTACVVLE